MVRVVFISRGIRSMIFIHSSSRSSRVQQTSAAIQPAPELQHVFDDQPIFPSHGFSNDRNDVHRPPCYIRHCLECHYVDYRPMEELGQYPPRIFAHRTDSRGSLAEQSFTCRIDGIDPLDLSLLCLCLLPLLRLRPGSPKELSFAL